MQLSVLETWALFWPPFSHRHVHCTDIYPAVPTDQAPLWVLGHSHKRDGRGHCSQGVLDWSKQQMVNEVTNVECTSGVGSEGEVGLGVERDRM